MIEQPTTEHKRSNVVKVLHWGDEPSRIMCLVGSSRLQSDFLNAAKAFTLRGYIVLTPDVYTTTTTDGINTDDQEILDEIAERKIQMSDIVFVVNPNNKIPESVHQQIKYAKSLGKEIRYLEQPRNTNP